MNVRHALLASVCAGTLAACGSAKHDNFSGHVKPDLKSESTQNPKLTAEIVVDARTNSLSNFSLPLYLTGFAWTADLRGQAVDPGPNGAGYPINTSTGNTIIPTIGCFSSETGTNDTTLFVRVTSVAIDYDALLARLGLAVVNQVKAWDQAGRIVLDASMLTIPLQYNFSCERAIQKVLGGSNVISLQFKNPIGGVDGVWELSGSTISVGRKTRIHCNEQTSDARDFFATLKNDSFVGADIRYGHYPVANAAGTTTKYISGQDFANTFSENFYASSVTDTGTRDVYNFVSYINQLKRIPSAIDSSLSSIDFVRESLAIKTDKFSGTMGRREMVEQLGLNNTTFATSINGSLGVQDSFKMAAAATFSRMRAPCDASVETKYLAVRNVLGTQPRMIQDPADATKQIEGNTSYITAMSIRYLPNTEGIIAGLELTNAISVADISNDDLKSGKFAPAYAFDLLGKKSVAIDVSNYSSVAPCYNASGRSALQLAAVRKDTLNIELLNIRYDQATANLSVEQTKVAENAIISTAQCLQPQGTSLGMIGIWTESDGMTADARKEYQVYKLP